MTLIEQLHQLDETLSLLLAAEEGALQSAIDEVEAGWRAAGHPVEIISRASPRGVLAGALGRVDRKCRLLQKRLGVTSIIHTGEQASLSIEMHLAGQDASETADDNPELPPSSAASE